MKQFFYTRKETVPSKEEGGESTVNTYQDSFSLDKVIRTIELEGGKRLVLLDDIHERLERVPQAVSGKKITYQKERNTFQSEIYLDKVDSDRLISAIQ